MGSSPIVSTTRDQRTSADERPTWQGSHDRGSQQGSLSILMAPLTVPQEPLHWRSAGLHVGARAWR